MSVETLTAPAPQAASAEKPNKFVTELNPTGIKPYVFLLAVVRFFLCGCGVLRRGTETDLGWNGLKMLRLP